MQIGLKPVCSKIQLAESRPYPATRTRNLYPVKVSNISLVRVLVTAHNQGKFGLRKVVAGDQSAPVCFCESLHDYRPQPKKRRAPKYCRRCKRRENDECQQSDGNSSPGLRGTVYVRPGRGPLWSKPNGFPLARPLLKLFRSNT